METTGDTSRKTRRRTENLEAHVIRERKEDFVREVFVVVVVVVSKRKKKKRKKICFFSGSIWETAGCFLLHFRLL